MDTAAGFMFASAAWFLIIGRMNYVYGKRRAVDRAEIFKLNGDLTAALEGKQPAAWLESAGMDIVVKQRPWDAQYDGPFKTVHDLTNVKEDGEQ